jgi:hypothetical protein
MEIIVDIRQGEDGRPEGTVRAAGRSNARSFSGNLEFLALVESLYRAHDPVDLGTVPSRRLMWMNDFS